MDSIYEQVKARLSEANGRVVIAAPGARTQIVLAPKDLPKIKPEGSGIRFGKTFAFACQIRFARVA